MAKPTSYLIQINEDQRKALRDLIAKANVDHEDSPLQFWVGMLDELQEEEDDPIFNGPHQMIHGFCL